MNGVYRRALVAAVTSLTLWGGLAAPAKAETPALWSIDPQVLIDTVPAEMPDGNPTVQPASWTW